MSPRRRKAEDADVFAAMGRVMRRVGPAELTLGAIAAEAGVTAGALVQRFGSKRELMLAHWRQAAAAGTPPDPPARAASPLQALRATAALYARLAASPRAALRNLAYMQSDWADAALRRHWRPSEATVVCTATAAEMRPRVEPLGLGDIDVVDYMSY